MSEYLRQITRLERENAALRAALKPFADAAAELPDGLRCTLRIWDGNLESSAGVIYLEAATTDHLHNAAKALKGETSLRRVDPLDIDMVTPAPRPPTASDHISELAAFLGHDTETTTEAGILADALAELARLRNANIRLEARIKTLKEDIAIAYEEDTE